jgi:hypothetical protein
MKYLGRLGLKTTQIICKATYGEPSGKTPSASSEEPVDYAAG